MSIKEPEDIKICVCSLYYNLIEINRYIYVECYKAIRSDYKSLYCPMSFTYDKINVIYSTECNYNYLRQNSFGFGCWTYNGAKFYGDNSNQKYIIVKALVPINSICVELFSEKIRSNNLIITNLDPQ